MCHLDISACLYYKILHLKFCIIMRRIISSVLSACRWLDDGLAQVTVNATISWHVQITIPKKLTWIGPEIYFSAGSDDLAVRISDECLLHNLPANLLWFTDTQWDSEISKKYFFYFYPYPHIKFNLMWGYPLSEKNHFSAFYCLELSALFTHLHCTRLFFLW